ncbi:MAG: trypsin domain protein [Thermoleophilia bacterium]|nr:trypsin domain protein [Thermoleophilia bacterium]
MTRTRLAAPSLPVFILAAAVVALLAFGITRWVTDRAAADTLPQLTITEGDTAAAAPGALDASKLFAARVDTSVSIESTIDGQPMNGSGVVVDTHGTIVTASHVVKDYEKALEATTIVVRFHKGDEVLAQLVAIDQMNDLAILKFDPTEVSGGVVAAPLADSDEVVVGSEIMSIGAPFGYEFTPTVGHVSATHRVLDSRINANSKIPDAIQHDGPVNTGNSGGPVYNARGQVIGINQQIASPAKVNSGVSFAVSSNLIVRAIKQYRATGERDIRYADLGIVARDITPQLAKQGNLAVSKGALVQLATGPAQDAGVGTGRAIDHLGTTVTLGDPIVEVGGQAISSADDLARAQTLLDPSAATTIVVLRGGKRVELAITPVARAL